MPAFEILNDTEEVEYLDEELGIVHLPRELLEHECPEQCRRRGHHHCDRETPLLRFVAAAASLSFALVAAADETARIVIHA